MVPIRSARLGSFSSPTLRSGWTLLSLVLMRRKDKVKAMKRRNDVLGHGGDRVAHCAVQRAIG